MGTAYESDVVAWANEQAALLRAGRIQDIDACQIAEEIEDVGRSAQSELGNRLSVLLAHLLQWKFQRDARRAAWARTIREQRRSLDRQLRRAPSLRQVFDDGEWLEDVWCDAARLARNGTGLDVPGAWLWSLDQVMDADFFPD
jgi:hypothetical protein